MFYDRALGPERLFCDYGPHILALLAFEGLIQNNGTVNHSFGKHPVGLLAAHTIRSYP